MLKALPPSLCRASRHTVNKHESSQRPVPASGFQTNRNLLQIKVESLPEEKSAMREVCEVLSKKIVCYLIG